MFYVLCVSVWTHIKGLQFCCSIVHFVLDLCLWVNCLALWLTAFPAGSWHLKSFFSSETVLDFLPCPVGFILLFFFFPSRRLWHTYTSKIHSICNHRYCEIFISQSFTGFHWAFPLSGMPPLNQNTSMYCMCSVCMYLHIYFNR